MTLHIYIDTESYPGGFGWECSVHARQMPAARPSTVEGLASHIQDWHDLGRMEILANIEALARSVRALDAGDLPAPRDGTTVLSDVQDAIEQLATPCRVHPEGCGVEQLMRHALEWTGLAIRLALEHRSEAARAAEASNE